ncbi:branched-chain amino acid transporter AzlC, partial [Bacillus sp. D-CC]
PKGVDKGWFMFFVTLLNHLYWGIGAAIGGIFGSLVHFNTKGLDFVMTALFVVIFVEQWMRKKKHYSALVGIVPKTTIPTVITCCSKLIVTRKPPLRSLLVFLG